MYQKSWVNAGSFIIPDGFSPKEKDSIIPIMVNFSGSYTCGYAYIGNNNNFSPSDKEHQFMVNASWITDDNFPSD